MSAKADFTDVIKFAARSGFLTKELWEAFFATGKERWRRRQWELLKERGYFLKHSSAHSRETLVLNPHNKTVQLLTGGFREKSPYLAEIFHDEVVIQGLLKLAKGNFINRFILEKQLRRENTNGFELKSWRKYPDAILHLKSGKMVAIEVELRQKSKARYREIFKSYQTVKAVSEIIYVCESWEIERAVKSAAEQFSRQLPPLRFVTLENWLNKPEQFVR